MSHFVCKVEDLPRGGRQLIKVGKRNIAVYNARGKLYAIDNACYHHGGPLLNGDIEDMGGHTCVSCPWHSYKISLQTGEGFYIGIEVGKDGKTSQCVKSKGVKQRTHEVTTVDGSIYVNVDVSGAKIDSDSYAEMDIANREKGTKTAVGGGGLGGLHSGLRSGHVLSGGGGSRTVPFGQQNPAAGGGGGSSAQPSEQMTCKVVKVVAASESENTKTFVFEKVDGKRVPRLEPGMYVTLAIPLSDEEGAEPQERTWTVSSVRGDLGGWFACTVKLVWPPTGRGGSAWLHQHSLEKVVPIVRFGGNFLIGKLRPQINNRKGAVLMLSAGIGITPMYASILKNFTDPFTIAAGPPLHIVHVHVDQSRAEMPCYSRLKEFHRDFSPKVPGKDPVSYQLNAFFTRQQEAEAEEDAVPPPPASSGSSGTSPSSTTTAASPSSPPGPRPHIVCGTRPSLKAIKDLCVKRLEPLGCITTGGAEGEKGSTSSAGDVKLNILVMLCGPQPFMDQMTDALSGSAGGVDRNDIHTEAFDF